jgi:hypothetical protein
MLTDLDKASLLEVLRRLPPRDLAVCEAACGALAAAARAPLLWRRHLARHYGLHLVRSRSGRGRGPTLSCALALPGGDQGPRGRRTAPRLRAPASPPPHPRPQDAADEARADLQTVYGRLAAARRRPSALRFLAAYTDGGTDGAAMGARRRARPAPGPPQPRRRGGGGDRGPAPRAGSPPPHLLPSRATRPPRRPPPAPRRPRRAPLLGGPRLHALPVGALLQRRAARRHRRGPAQGAA